MCHRRASAKKGANQRTIRFWCNFSGVGSHAFRRCFGIKKQILKKQLLIIAKNSFILMFLFAKWLIFYHKKPLMVSSRVLKNCFELKN